eukprot:scaffold234668_cov49-Prasinocladus_malaysianus.AAC.2
MGYDACSYQCRRANKVQMVSTVAFLRCFEKLVNWQAESHELRAEARSKRRMKSRVVELLKWSAKVANRIMQRLDPEAAAASRQLCVSSVYDPTQEDAKAAFVADDGIDGCLMRSWTCEICITKGWQIVIVAMCANTRRQKGFIYTQLFFSASPKSSIVTSMVKRPVFQLCDEMAS